MSERNTLAIRIAEDQIRADVSRGNRDGHPGSDYPMDDWTVVLRWEGRSLPVSWWTGVGLTGTPTAGDVLARLLSDAAEVEQGEGFEGWCGRHDLDRENRQYKNRYQALVRQVGTLRALLGTKYDVYLRETDFQEDPTMYEASNWRMAAVTVASPHRMSKARRRR